MIGRHKEQSVIPVPTWALNDEDLVKLADTLREVDSEAEPDDPPDARSVACMKAIKAELEYRGSTFRLNDDGSISREPKP